VTVRRSLTLVALTLCCLLGFAITPALAGDPNQTVEASPTRDGQVKREVGVQVTRVRGDTVDSTNTAVANPHGCTGCEGVAVAFQAVIATGRPTTIAPQNVAAAVNSSCTQCRAFAFAYQYVITTDGARAKLSRDGRERVDEIEERVEDAVEAGLPYDQLDARLKQLGIEFRTAVKEELVQKGERPGEDRADRRSDDAGEDEDGDEQAQPGQPAGA